VASSRRAPLLALGRLVVTAGLVIVLYYLIPVEPGVSGTRLAWRVVATALAGLVVTWLIFRQLSHQLADPEEASLIDLLTALMGGIAFFAPADYLTAISGTDQFAGLHTKTDALYFALATVTTVGYGDVHATGQVARVVVSCQLVFNILVITTGASVLTRQIGTRVRGRVSARAPRNRAGSADPAD
jgi:voltage-gated potassium channel